MTTNDIQQRDISIKTVISLAIITFLGPSAIDMYLAAMPKITDDLNTDYATTQLTLTVFLIAMGAGQLIFGPVIDALGRRRPLLIGLAIFSLTSLWAASTDSISIMLYARFFQGLSAALVLVVAMSSVRDIASGTRATQLFAILISIQGIAPILAPAIGGIIEVKFGWRAVMIALGILGVLTLFNSAINLPESLAVEKRQPLRLRHMLTFYARLLRDIRFILPALTLTAVFFFLFAYIGGASYIYQVNYGLRPDSFGLVFGGTAIAIMLGAICSSKMARTISANNLMLAGNVCISIGSLLALLGALVGLGLPGIVAGISLAVFGLGIAEPPLMSIAMASQNQGLGATAAMLGAGSNVLGSLATPLAGVLVPKGTTAWLSLLLIASLIALVLAFISHRFNKSLN